MACAKEVLYLGYFPTHKHQSTLKRQDSCRILQSGLRRAVPVPTAAPFLEQGSTSCASWKFQCLGEFPSIHVAAFNE